MPAKGLWNAWAWWPGRSSKPVCGLEGGCGGSIPPHSALRVEGREMIGEAAAFYDGLAGRYHLIFGDWEGAVRWQGEVLERLIRAELAGILREAGFRDVAWQMPETSGYYQPVVTARRG